MLQSKIQNLMTEERIANLNSNTISPQSQGVDMSRQNSTSYQNFDTYTNTNITFGESENTYSRSSDTCYTEEELPHMNILNQALYSICKDPKSMELLINFIFNCLVLEFNKIYNLKNLVLILYELFLKMFDLDIAL